MANNRPNAPHEPDHAFLVRTDRANLPEVQELNGDTAWAEYQELEEEFKTQFESTLPQEPPAGAAAP